MENIKYDNIINAKISYHNELRTQPSQLSFMRRVCIKCIKNLSLRYFSNIERKGAYKSICCNCIKINNQILIL